jgi:hypothetical protein
MFVDRRFVFFFFGVSECGSFGSGGFRLFSFIHEERNIVLAAALGRKFCHDQMILGVLRVLVVAFYIYGGGWLIFAGGA